MDKENLKIGLLGVIALTLMINTYFVATSKKTITATAPTEDVGSSKAASDMPVTNTNTSPTTPTSTINSNPVNNATPTNPNQKSTAISFAKFEHDYGQVAPESANRYAFVFTNTGKEPLIISGATGSCGCTVPNYPKEPIMPGKTGKIDVEFKPSATQLGPQEKTVTVTANTDPAQTILKIKANVK